MPSKSPSEANREKCREYIKYHETPVEERDGHTVFTLICITERILHGAHRRKQKHTRNQPEKEANPCGNSQL